MARFAVELRRLREAAGRPGYRELARRAHYSVATLAEAAGGKVLPSLQVTLAYVEACGGDSGAWEARWREVAEELAAADAAAGEELETAPYRGLMTFGPGDAEWFFGRRRLVGRLLERLSTASFVAVFGPSGSGKSSLLRAGLLPALERGGIPGSAGWRVLLFTPGSHPMEALASGLAAVTGASARSLHDDLMAEPARIRPALRRVLPAGAKTPCVVFVVDQFEEAFTLCRDAAERARFVDCLLAAGGIDGHGDLACRVVLGVRADFYARCAEYPALVAALNDRQLLVGSMSDDELREVATGPAAHAGLKIERALVEVIVADARGEPGALPLVSHALLETWRRRKADVLTLAVYRGAGGIHGGIAQSAERVFAGFDPDGQRIVHRLFLRLTALGEGTEDTRRRVPMAELLDGQNGQDGQAVSAVLERLSAARLLTVGQDEVQVAHEALIRHWPRLRGWLADDRDLLVAHRRLTEAAVEWDRHGRDDGLLYRGPRLAAWDNRDLGRLNALEREFLAAGRGRRAREHGARRRRVRLAAAGMVAALAAMSVLAATALVQAGRAAGERDLAVSRQLVASARSQLPVDPVGAIRLARRAYGIKPTVQAEDTLRQATLEAGLSQIITQPGIQPVGGIVGVAFSPDGRRLAVQDEIQISTYTVTRDGVSGRVSLWNTDGGGGQGPPVFHPSGRYLVAVDGYHTINVWNASGHADTAPLWFGHPYDKALAVAFGPDGRWLASAGGDGTVRTWNWAARGHQSTLVGTFPGRALRVAVSPDGRHIAAGGADGTVRIWDRAAPAARPVILRTHEGAARALTYSPDGRHLAAGAGGTIRIWNANGRGAPSVLRTQTGAATTLAYSPDGRQLVAAGAGGTIGIWDTAHAVPAAGTPRTLDGSPGAVTTIAFAPDGHAVISGQDDGTTRLWDVTGSGEPVVLRGHAGPVWDATASRDGRKIATVGEDGTARIWNADGTGRPIILHSDRRLFGVAFSPGGTDVAGIGDDGVIHIWSSDGTGRPITLRGAPEGVRGLAFTPDGRNLLTIGHVALDRWDVTRDNGDPTRGFPNPAALAPATASWQTRRATGTIRLYVPDPNMWRHHRGLAFEMMVSANGQIIAQVMPPSRDLALENPTGTGHPIILRGNQGRLRSVAVSQDGQLVAATATDDTIRIWRTTGDGEPLIFRDHGVAAENIQFAPDGHIITTYDDGTTHIWRCEVCGPIDDVLHLADQRTRNNQ
ncbi:MAG TPA: AAA family ATPase [Streptosporangiaceae bacterium]